MDAGMSSFKNPNGSNQNPSRRLPNNNLDFAPMDSYENPQASRGNTMSSYNQQPYMNQQSYMNQQQHMSQPPLNYNQQYPRSNTMSVPPSAMNHHKGSGFSSMFKKKNDSKKNGGYEKDDDEDVLMGDNENIVSFNDISGFRKAGGPAYGFNNSSDTAPIIPTILTTGTNIDPNKMNNTTYRKMLTNQKKAALSQFNRQAKDDFGNPRAMTMQSNQPPRAMTFQNGQQFRPPQGIPGPPPFGSKHATSQGSRSNSMMNGMRQNTFQQNKMQAPFPNKAMTMGQGNKAPFMPPQQMGNPNYRANSMQMRNMPQQDVNKNMNGSYFQQQQRLHGGMQQQQSPYVSREQLPQSPYATRDEQSQKGPYSSKEKLPQTQEVPYVSAEQKQPKESLYGSEEEQPKQSPYGSEEEQPKQSPYGSREEQPNKSPYGSREEQPKQSHYGSREEQPKQSPYGSREDQKPKQRSYSSHDQQSLPVVDENIDFGKAPEMSNDSLPAHKKSESIKLRPNSALFKGFDNQNEDLHEDFKPIKLENFDMETPKQVYRNSAISFNSPIPENALVQKNREFYQMGKGLNTTGDFFTAPELPLTKEVDVGTKDNASISDSVSMKSKTKNFFKRMSGISSNSRSNSNVLDQANDFKVHSVVKNNDDSLSDTDKKLVMSAKNRNNYTFKASKSSFADMITPNNTNVNQDSDYVTRQSYHSLFTNEDFSVSNKPSSAKEEQETATNDTICDEEEEVRKISNDINSSIYDHEETKQNVSLKSYSQDPRSQVTTKEPEQTSDIKAESDNELHQKLMKEIFILSEELTESIVRETDLERKLLSPQCTNTSVSSSPAKNSATGTVNSANASNGLLDVQLELRKKSKNIVQLIKDLNEERMKRFIAEEEVLNIKNGCKPDFLELSYKYKKMEGEMAEKNEIIRSLKEKLESGL